MTGHHVFVYRLHRCTTGSYCGSQNVNSDLSPTLLVSSLRLHRCIHGGKLAPTPSWTNLDPMATPHFKWHKVYWFSRWAHPRPCMIRLWRMSCKPHVHHLLYFSCAAMKFHCFGPRHSLISFSVRCMPAYMQALANYPGNSENGGDIA